MYLFDFPSDDLRLSDDWLGLAPSPPNPLYNYNYDDNSGLSTTVSGLDPSADSANALFDRYIINPDNDGSDSDQNEDIDPFSQRAGEEYTLFDNQAHPKTSLDFYDAPYDDTDGDGSDDDYVPSPILQSHKQLPSPRNNLNTMLPSADLIPFPSSRRRSATRNRKNQKSEDTSTCHFSEISFHEKHNPWACPHPSCDWIQTNKRTPDLKRHIKKHDPPEWQCAGCQRKFSRRDALRRHVRNKNNSCVDMFTSED